MSQYPYSSQPYGSSHDSSYGYIPQEHPEVDPRYYPPGAYPGTYPDDSYPVYSGDYPAPVPIDHHPDFLASISHDYQLRASQNIAQLDQMLAHHQADYYREQAAEAAYQQTHNPVGYGQYQRFAAQYNNAYQRGYSLPHVYAANLLS